ncbi:hypothetical protein [Bacillus weihaiensis]|uniref:hypothetical protein n=1 Tax=Bacillus weihaiensis TaxID=1547283 RepID=UPI002357612C|nr:hypothetical protein [Bacillus weihaiensis]
MENKTVNINDYRNEKDAGIEEFKNYINEAVKSNRDTIASLIVNGMQGETLIDTYVDKLIGHAFSNYSKEILLKYMSNGVIITATQILTDKFLNDKKIKQALQHQMAVV